MSRTKLTRRDFINGVAIGAAGFNLSPLEAIAEGLLPHSSLGPDYYPPALTGLRGSHPGSFDAAHAIAREGKSFPIPKLQTEATYDLVVVGGGISGLAAAKFFRDRHGPSSRILVLDNHDDFGGHARRNELDVDGKQLIGYGGSQNLQTPSKYSKVSKQLLIDLNIHVDRFYEYFDHNYLKDRGLQDRPGMYLDAKTFGHRALVDDVISPWSDAETDTQASVAALPLSESDKQAFLTLLEGGMDYLQGRTVDEKIQLLNNTSYLDYLREYAKTPDAVLELIRDSFLGMIGVGWEADSALYAADYGFPGTTALELPKRLDEYEPYIHHFPDGNASLARALVRDLVPGSIPGDSMEDVVTARANYAMLDTTDNGVRIRLSSTAINVRNTADDSAVDVTYVNAGNLYRVRGRHVVLACYNQILPYLCNEMPTEQVDALRYASKTPYVIGAFALRNWTAFKDAGYYSIYSPGNVLFKNIGLDFPVSMGDYQYSRGPDSPIVIDAWHSPTARGLPMKDQYRVGRAKMLGMSFEDYQSDIFAHFDGMLGPHGFDAERDIAAITLNRWPHGYAYEYGGIGVPLEYDRHTGPHVAGRAQLGRISIANSDSEAYAYADGAIDAADRAVNEQLSL